MDGLNEPDAYVIGRCEPTGPFSVWDPYLDMVWPPILGSTSLATVRAIALAVDQLEDGAVVELADLAALIGVAPTRFVSAAERAQPHRLLQATYGQFLVPDGLHGPNASQIETLPTITQEAASVRLASFAEGAPITRQ